MACSSSLVNPTVRNWSSARPSSVSTPERAVLGIDEVDGLLDDAAEHHGQVQLGVEDENGLDETAQLCGIVDPVERLHGVPG